MLEQAKSGGSGNTPNAVGAAGGAAPQKPRGNSKEARKARAEKRAQLAPKRKEIQKLEKKVASLQADRDKLEALIADPETYNKDAAYQAKLSSELGQIKAAQEETEETWLMALEELEQMETEMAAE